MTNLGLLRLHMRGEVPEAEAWSRKAADAGDAGAMNLLGAILLGRGEPAGAETWWRKAVQAGDTHAVSNLLGLIKAKGEAGEDKLRKVVEVQWHLPGEETSD
jgi:TPR repeat protein